VGSGPGPAAPTGSEELGRSRCQSGGGQIGIGPGSTAQQLLRGAGAPQPSSTLTPPGSLLCPSTKQNTNALLFFLFSIAVSGDASLRWGSMVQYGSFAAERGGVSALVLPCRKMPAHRWGASGAARRPCALRLYGSPRLACARPLRLAAVRRETGKAAVRAAPPVARGPHYVRVCCAAAGPVAPEDTWAEMKDSTEEIRGRSGSRVKVYAGVALVAIAVSKRPCRLLACLPTGDARRGLGRAGDALFRSRLSLSRCGECLGRLQRHAALRRRPTDACACICVCARALSLCCNRTRTRAHMHSSHDLFLSLSLSLSLSRPLSQVPPDEAGTRWHGDHPGEGPRKIQ
jgi:hypothetical protein